MDILKLQNDFDQMRGEKRALEECVTQQVAKRICLEKKLKTALEKAQKRDAQHKKRFRRLAKKVADICSQKKSRGPATTKSFRQYTRQHQARIRKQLKEHCHTTLSFLGLHNYIATKVEVYNEDTCQMETFNLLEEEELPFIESGEKNITGQELDNLNMWLYLRDKFNICNEAWREFSAMSKDVPRLIQMTERLSELKGSWELKCTPGQAEGVQIKFEDSLRVTS